MNSLLAALLAILALTAQCSSGEELFFWEIGDSEPQAYFKSDKSEVGILLLVSTQWAGQLNKIYKETIINYQKNKNLKSVRLYEYDVSNPAQERLVKELLKRYKISYCPAVLFSTDGSNWHVSRSPNELNGEGGNLKNSILNELKRITQSEE